MEISVSIAVRLHGIKAHGSSTNVEVMSACLRAVFGQESGGALHSLKADWLKG